MKNPKKIINVLLVILLFASAIIAAPFLRKQKPKSDCQCLTQIEPIRNLNPIIR